MLYRTGLFPIVVVAALILFAACDSVIDDPPPIDGTDLAVNTIAPEDSTEEITAENFEEGSHGMLTERHHELIQTQEAFENFWETLFSHRSELPEPPEIDFNEFYVVFASIGSRPNGGYSVSISDARHLPDENQVVVEVTEEQPGEGCAAIQVITYPYVLATVERVEGADYVINETDPVTRDC